MKISEKTCVEFVDVLASKSAVPGGGGAAALVGAIGMALGSMVCNLTIGKKKYAQTHGLCISDVPSRFPVIDFYLWACAYHNIYGVKADNLHLIDVGKLDSLEAAELFLESQGC